MRGDLHPLGYVIVSMFLAGGLAVCALVLATVESVAALRRLKALGEFLALAILFLALGAAAGAIGAGVAACLESAVYAPITAPGAAR
jgi:hypothetical protein